MKEKIKKLISRYLPNIEYSSSSGREIFLTFDDGPTNETSNVLDILDKNSIPATFFLVGKRLKGKEKIVADIHSLGHAIGNHSFSHTSAREQDFQSLTKDYNNCKEIIEDIIPEWTQRTIRPPYGHINLNLYRYAIRNSSDIVMWSNDSNDYCSSSVKDVIGNLGNINSGDVLLFHDEKKLTTSVLEYLVPRLLDEGFEFRSY